LSPADRFYFPQFDDAAGGMVPAVIAGSWEAEGYGRGSAGCDAALESCSRGQNRRGGRELERERAAENHVAATERLPGNSRQATPVAEKTTMLR
jgi:hypothetical protein